MLSQRLQRRHYAVAAEETNKGVVSSLDDGNNVGKDEAEKRMYRILMTPSCKGIPQTI